MANALGYVTKTKSGFDGTLSLIDFSAALKLVKNEEKSQDHHPDYLILAGQTDTDIGGGWNKRAKDSGSKYVSMTIQSPELGPRKIYANMVPVKGKRGRHVILWSARD